MRLKKGDTVIVLSGKYKGRTAKIVATQPRQNSVSLEGINVVTRHRRATPTNPRATSFELHRPLPVSKVAYYDSGAKKASRLGFKLAKAGQKSRILKTSGKEVK